MELFWHTPTRVGGLKTGYKSLEMTRNGNHVAFFLRMNGLALKCCLLRSKQNAEGNLEWFRGKVLTPSPIQHATGQLATGKLIIQFISSSKPRNGFSPIDFSCYSFTSRELVERFGPKSAQKFPPKILQGCKKFHFICVATLHHFTIFTLPDTNMSPENRPGPKRKVIT